MRGVDRDDLDERTDRSVRCARRIHVVGTSGSGKTTFAVRLAERLGVPHVELDGLFWGPDWSKAPERAFREEVEAVTRQPAWVIDGNYSRIRDLIWQRADQVIWLDYKFLVILLRVIRRTLGRGLTREVLWHGNRESLRTSLFSRDSIILWSIRTYRRRKGDYDRLLRRPENCRPQVLHIQTVRRAQQVLDNPYLHLGSGGE